LFLPFKARSGQPFASDNARRGDSCRFVGLGLQTHADGALGREALAHR